ncbi:hypothetical protein OG756_02715 [Streptomyces sp. NBC_01310]|uniref:hypothetical protein n=1 Tax=Streptomyces sp. NBC_01310 TaxID=2903820 RepID=UPI0035B63F03|nr:hypothetical protein OG756_02715 [Streptomyces sp. NBC_01310]
MTRGRTTMLAAALAGGRVLGTALLAGGLAGGAAAAHADGADLSDRCSKQPYAVEGGGYVFT